MMSDTLLLFLNLAGIGFFAISGTLLGERKSVNGFGIIVLATLTATGGGTIRDLLLNKPVFWIEDSIYLLTNFVAIMVSILFIRRFPSPDSRYFLIVDAAGLALFNIIGIFKATQAGADLVVALTMGVITSVFGGDFAGCNLQRSAGYAEEPAVCHNLHSRRADLCRYNEFRLEHLYLCRNGFQHHVCYAYIGHI